MRPRQHRVVLARNKGLITRAGMVPVPKNLTPNQISPYPSDNTVPFERWYMENFVDADARERIYLPIQWTALYCNNNYGKCAKTKLHIQSFLDAIDRGKKYYTIVQYDDGILNKIDHLDIKVFAMSGPRVDYPLPLLAMPHKYQFNENRDIFASFVGRATHPIRSQIISQLQGHKWCYISTKPHTLDQYCNILSRSTYALCPRGYGQTSFRIQEAIQYGATPVYISDDFIVPYNLEGIFPMIHSDHIDGLAEFLLIGLALRDWPTLIKPHAHLFTYQGCKKEILKHLSNDTTA